MFTQTLISDLETNILHLQKKCIWIIFMFFPGLQPAAKVESCYKISSSSCNLHQIIPIIQPQTFSAFNRKKTETRKKKSETRNWKIVVTPTANCVLTTTEIILQCLCKATKKISQHGLKVGSGWHMFRDPELDCQVNPIETVAYVGFEGWTVNTYFVFFSSISNKCFS